MCFGGNSPAPAAPAPPPMPAQSLMQSAPDRADQDRNKRPKRPNRTPDAGTKYRTGAANPLAIGSVAAPGITRSGGLGI